ncbi:unnamed protein product [Penicillium olsonii]|nr:unnamed protein product [Penicillium olsonii]
MPLDEEGAKWSWYDNSISISNVPRLTIPSEPCIRGHRSSKCQHFDRLMMKVPKAGRPLAKCPHPKGTCSCQKTYAVMVRIPKGSSCLCRPLYEVPMDGNEPTRSPTSSTPSTSSPAPGKVQKSGRRQSTMQAAPQNIARALDSMPDSLKIEEGTPRLLSSRPLQSELDASSKPSVFVKPTQVSSPQEPARDSSQSPPVSSCCSQKPKASTPAPEPAQAPSNVSHSQPAQNGGSCCSSRPPAANQPTHQDSNKKDFQHSNTWSNEPYMHLRESQVNPWQNQPTHSHGGYMHPPMGRAQPQQHFSQNGYLQMLPSHSPQMLTSPPSMGYHNSMNGLGITQPSLDPFRLNQPQSSFAAPPSGDPCHECSCGEDCQCLGCASHPFNTTTRKHVQEMGAMITFNGDETNSDAMNPYQPAPFQAGPPSNAFPYLMRNGPSLDHGFQPHSYNGYADPNSALPNGYSSLATNHHMNQQLMHPSEYYTLEYPVGLPSACSDVTGSCQCGNDCSCVGCLTHSGHSGLSLDMAAPEQPVSEIAALQNVHHTQHPITTSQHPLLDGLSVPCLSPRTLETSMI